MKNPKITITLSEELHKAIRKEAKRDGRSVSGMIRYILVRHYAKKDGEMT